MKRQIPLLALLLATQSGCSILSGNTVSVPIASNNGNNNGSQNGSYNSASAAATTPEQLAIGVTRLADPVATAGTGSTTPVILPASVSLNRVSTEIAKLDLPHTESGAVDLQSIYYGGETKPAMTMGASAPTAPARTTASAAGAADAVYTGSSGSR